MADAFKAAWRGRRLKQDTSANLDHAKRKIQRFKTDSLKRLRMQRTGKGMGKLRRLHPLQESEDKWPCWSMPVCGRHRPAVRRIQTEFLIPWISTKGFSTLLLTLTVLLLLLLLLVPSRHSACRGPVGSVSDCECILMSMMGIVMKSSVTRTEILPAHVARVLTARSSR